MPLTARGPLGQVDATSCPDAVWESLYRTRPRAELTCRGCQAPMHAKVSSRGLRFFAHDAAAPKCPSAGETPEHRELKNSVAEMVRAAGWEAFVEAEPGAGDRGGWRADVLAALPEQPRRVAFEIQLSGMTPAEGKERTGRYGADGIEVVWISTRHARWLYEIPGVRVCRRADALGALVADRGLARTPKDLVPAPPLSEVIVDFLGGQLLVDPIGEFYDQIPFGERTREYWVRDAVALRTPAEAAARQATEAKLRAHFAALEEHERHRAALMARQQAALPSALADAEAALTSNQRIQVGVPAKDVVGVVTSEEARGNERTAYGRVVWIRDGLIRETKLFAVVCPVAGRIGPGLAKSWATRGVRIYAADEGEASHLASVLGWSFRDIHVAGVPATPSPG